MEIFDALMAGFATAITPAIQRMASRGAKAYAVGSPFEEGERDAGLSRNEELRAYAQAGGAAASWVGQKLSLRRGDLRILVGAGAGAAIAVPANIASKEDLQNLVDETRKAFGKVDILVCNAARQQSRPSILDISTDEFLK